MNANEILFRASSTGKLMTEPRSKTETLSETTKTYLTEVYVNEMYGRKKDITNKYILKGLRVEEDSITLFSRVTKTFFKKNEEQQRNEFIKGTPDIFIGESIHKADEVIDIKSSYDIFTYFNSIKSKEVNKDYYYQLQSYMALTGAKSARLVYCLTNTPEQMIADAKRKLSWQMGLIDNDASPEYLEACLELNRLSVYDDIPMADRVTQIEVKRNDADIEKLYSRIKECRTWMAENLIKQEIFA
jgi:hypothetical protein